MEQKKLLHLGGSYFQIPCIKTAKESGHYVVTCDYLPDNPGHAYSDKYYNVSTTDKEAVLNLAKEIGADGIVAYASDPAAPTAAYVANKLGLPSSSFDSVNILARKDLFRATLKNNNFNCPSFVVFSIKNYNGDNSSIKDFIQKTLTFPAVLKPVDSSGSKGVSVLYSIDQLDSAVTYATPFSKVGKCILEEFVNKKGPQIAGDGFVVNGQLVFRLFANEHFSKEIKGSVVPIGESFPYIREDKLQDAVHKEIQRFLTIIGYTQGALNFDIRIDDNDSVWLMEIGPRNGGNLIPDVTKLATNIDMIKATIDIALGLDCSYVHLVPPIGYWASFIIHSTKSGILTEYKCKESFEKNIVDKRIFVQPGSQINVFTGSNHSLGAMVLKFESEKEMLEKMDNMNQYFEVLVKE
jgi:biotin carboxylase